MDLIQAVYATQVRMDMPIRSADMEDVLQEAAIDAWQFAGEVTNAQALADTIVRHSCLFALTRERRLKRGGGKVELLGNALSDKATDDCQPLAILCETEEAGMLWDVVAGLPENQARAIKLRFASDLSYQEVADELGVSLQAVGGLLKRGLKTLRERLA